MGFKKKTVFVVGAGAHVDYGMPTGAEIVIDLIDWLAAYEGGRSSGKIDDAINLVAGPIGDNGGVSQSRRDDLLEGHLNRLFKGRRVEFGDARVGCLEFLNQRWKIE